MSQTSRLGKTATSVRTENGWTIVRYHDTDVVSFNEKEIILRTGGWRTTTTKLRMNQASNQFGLGYQVWQKDFQWYISFNYDSQHEMGVANGAHTLTFDESYDPICICRKIA